MNRNKDECDFLFATRAFEPKSRTLNSHISGLTHRGERKRAVRRVPIDHYTGRWTPWRIWMVIRAMREWKSIVFLSWYNELWNWMKMSLKLSERRQPVMSKVMVEVVIIHRDPRANFAADIQNSNLLMNIFFIRKTVRCKDLLLEILCITSSKKVWLRLKIVGRYLGRRIIS